MSGIYGILGGGKARLRELSLMSEALVHRGPDAVGSYVDDNIVMGCRLLQTGSNHGQHQPVGHDGANVYAVLDGAIYNHVELRRELERAGRPGGQVTPAEILVRLYEVYGPDCIGRIRGHFAYALWDARSRELILARDHLGQKPLFYYQAPGGGFYFASEARALLAILHDSPQLNPDALDRYLSMRFVPGRETMVRGIEKVPPAHFIVRNGANSRTVRHWQLSFATKLNVPHDEYIELLGRKLRETVACHLADNDTGAFLSGGLDSSLIVAMMAKESTRPVPTFSIGFRERAFNETAFARTVSERFGTQHHEAVADTDLIRSLPAIVQGLGEPSDPVAVSFYAASRLAAQHVKVALGGEGGNELFAGCDRYRGVMLSDYYSLVPVAIRNAIVSPLVAAIPSSFGYESLKMKLSWFERMSATNGSGERLSEAVAFFRFNRQEKDALLADNISSQLDPGAAAREISDLFYQSDAEHPIERMVYADYCTRLPEHLLMVSVRMSMTHGLEVRSPLVDKELVECMASFPLNMKVRRHKSRYIWYKLAERELPKSIAKRKKRGFRFPLAYWFAVKLQPFLHGVFEDSCLVEDGVFNRGYMLRVLEEHRSRQVDHSWKIWMLLNLEIWYRLTIRGFALADTERWVDRHMSSPASRPPTHT